MTLNVRFLSRADVAACLDLDDAIALARTTFAALARGRFVAPHRTVLAVPNGSTLVMPAAWPDGGATTVKIVSVCPSNAGRGLPTTLGLLHVLDAATGEPLAIMDAGLLTALRTAAASAVATETLAAPDAGVLGMVGAGLQARYQVEAIARVRRLREVRVFSRDPERRRLFCDQLRACLENDGPTVRQEKDAASAVRGAGIVCTATTSSDPVLDERDVDAGAHVNAVGAYRLDMAELPHELVRGARVVVDSLAAARAEAGDLEQAANAGAMSWDHVDELGEILIGQKPGRRSTEGRTIFKSVGLAAQDVVAGAFVARRAIELGIGITAEV